MIKREFPIILLYILLFAGGIWVQLGFFQELLPKLSSFFIISISIFSIYLLTLINNIKNKYIYFFSLLFIFITSVYIEYIGVTTSLLFGKYSYTLTIQPQIKKVPIAIGFAWISTIIASFGILNLILRNQTFLNFKIIKSVVNIIPNNQYLNNYYFKLATLSILNGILMTFFDIIMEPAAVELNYWLWQDSIIPFYNYFCWFLFGSIFSFILLLNFKLDFKDNICQNENLSNLKHIYLSQILYFIIVLI